MPQLEGDHTVKATTTNVSAISFDMEAGAQMITPAAKVTVVLDGQTLAVPGAATDGSWTAHFRKNGSSGPWPAMDTNTLRKRARPAGAH